MKVDKKVFLLALLMACVRLFGESDILIDEKSFHNFRKVNDGAVIQNRHMSEQVEGLKDKAYRISAVRRQLSVAHPTELDAVEAYGAAVKAIHTSEHIQQCALSAAGVTQHRDKL